MASKFGRGLYGAAAYSRDFSTGRAVLGGSSFVGVVSEVQLHALVSINAAASVGVTGRLLWDHIPVEPCEGVWAPLVDSPCRRAA
jgi:hypothetical protein